ncbi:MAG: PD40 domain-containing protein [Sphingomonadales bacterium]|nr:PD40 domain-containing protein [Sphingomonadales bacterium]MDE2568763.1 PD40 domain-containing protein [Sphingomonadales bacterium]
MARIDQGTNFAVAPSPDGRHLAFDLGGAIWLLASTGGAAEMLTDTLTDGAMPTWMPDGSAILFQSYRTGNYHIWRVTPQERTLTQITTGLYDCREPAVSPDGRSLAYVCDEDGSSKIRMLDFASGEVKVWANTPGEAAQPCWSADGKTITYCADGRRIMTVTRDGKPVEVAVAPRAHGPLLKSQLVGPAFTPDGSVAFVRVADAETTIEWGGEVRVKGEDVFPFRPYWLADGSMVYSADGEIRRLAAGVAQATAIAFTAQLPVARANYRRKQTQPSGPQRRPVIGIGSPALSPDARQVVFRALNALWLMEIGKPPRRIHDSGACVVDPAWSPYGRQIVFSCDKDGQLDLWVHDLASGKERRVTFTTGAAIAPAWSPDGKTIAFHDQDGATYALELETGKISRLQSPLWLPGRPSWGPDGRTLAMAALRPASPRFREGWSQILTLDLGSGKARYQSVGPNKSIATRGDDGPVWSPDGRMMAFVLGSRLHVCTVGPDGTITGTPRALNAEATDAPSWSGDSKQILYLSKGKLRLIDAAGGVPRTVPLRLDWAAAKAPPRKVIRAGRLWTGHSPAQQSHVDIELKGDRIARITPASGELPRDNPDFVDAGELTAIPGLVDAHVHLQMRNAGFGDREGRLWLALGITGVRSLCGGAYQAVEYREAIQSGARVGPRSFVTGEAIDGSRIFYHMMRPVTEPGQLDLEFERAAALGYDLMKCYVRLPMAMQRDVVNWAHRRGIPATSHYLYPSALFGIDSMEHMGATNKLGYSHTVSQTGRVYHDVDALLAGAGTTQTPTLFQSNALHKADPSLIDDERIKTLIPHWELDRLRRMIETMTDDEVTAQLKILERNVAHIKRAGSLGVIIVTGTDAPLDLLGVSLHMNLRAMVKFGMSPYESLVTATRNAGKLLAEPLGLIEPGAWADLVLTRGNPLERIEDTANVAAVIAGGILHKPDDLMARFKDLPKRIDAVTMLSSYNDDRHYWWHSQAFLDNSRRKCCSCA